MEIWISCRTFLYMNPGNDSSISVGKKLNFTKNMDVYFSVDVDGDG